MRSPAGLVMPSHPACESRLSGYLGELSTRSLAEIVLETGQGTDSSGVRIMRRRPAGRRPG